MYCNLPLIEYTCYQQSKNANHMSPQSRHALGLAALLEQVARAIYEERGPRSIQPGQWSSLRYFERAGPRARNVSGLARYLGVTLGTASRSAAALAKRGLIIARPNPEDGRSIIYDLSEAGAATLANDPLNRLANAIETIEGEDRAAFARTVMRLADRLGAIEETA